MKDYREVEVTIPLTVSASMTFSVERGVEVTEDLIMEKLRAAQRAFDRRGDDESGIYVQISDAHGAPEFYDEWAEVDSDYASESS